MEKNVRKRREDYPFFLAAENSLLCETTREAKAISSSIRIDVSLLSYSGLTSQNFY
jgi:hypothetical protein